MIERTTSWSHTQHGLLRECVRRWYFQYRMADGWAPDGMRREAFVLKRLQSIPMWWGDLIHHGIANWVVPAWQRGEEPDLAGAAEATIDLARHQYAFSRDRLYRDRYRSPKKEAAYAALQHHEYGEEDGREARTADVIREAFSQLSNVAAEAGVRTGATIELVEKLLDLPIYGVTLWAKLDLVLRHIDGILLVIDWKTGANDGDPRQFYAYALMCTEHPELKVPLDRLRLRAVNLAAGSVRDFDVREDDLDRVASRIYEDAKLMEALPAPESEQAGREVLASIPPAHSPRVCQHCPFRRPCLEVA
jgi:PD-(D/E)XK nuclease superfamily protein